MKLNHVPARLRVGAFVALVFAPIVASAQIAGTVTYRNPFGLLAQKADGTFQETSGSGCAGGGAPAESKLDTAARMHAGHLLSTPYVRMSTSVENWLHVVDPVNFDINRTNRNGCGAAGYYESSRIRDLKTYKTYINAGYRVLLNVGYRNQLEDFAPGIGGADYANRPIGDTATGKDPDFKRALAALLQELTSYTSTNGYSGKPEMLVVENEENFNTTTNNDENLANYLRVIAQVVDVAHHGFDYDDNVNNVHVHFHTPLAVTNGGLIDAGLRMEIWTKLVEDNPGNPTPAFTFADKYLRWHNDYFDTGFFGDAAHVTAAGTATQQQTRKLVNGVSGYPYSGLKSAGLDYFNFHSYSPWPNRTVSTQDRNSPNVTAELPVLNDYVAFFKGLNPAIPVITNEIGSLTSWEYENAWGSGAAGVAVTSILSKVHDELRLPYVIWYSGNNDFFFPYDSGGGKANADQQRYVALTDALGDLEYTQGQANGGNIPPPPSGQNALGLAFRNFVTASSRFGANYWKTSTLVTPFFDDFSSATLVNWLCSGPGSALTRFSSGSLTAMKLANGGTTARHALNYVLPAASAQKLQVGDALTLSFDFEFTGSASALEALHAGIFNSSGTRVNANNLGGADDTSSSVFNAYDGYRAKAPLTTSGPLVLGARQRQSSGNAALLCTELAYPSTRTIATASVSSVPSPGSIYACTLTVARLAYRTLSVSFALTDGSTQVYSVADIYEIPEAAAGGYADNDDSPFTFDTVAFGIPSNAGTVPAYYFDNVKVTYQAAPRPTPLPVASLDSSSNIVLGSTANFTVNMSGVADAQPWHAEWFKQSSGSGTALQVSGNNVTSNVYTAGTADTYSAIVMNPAAWIVATPAMLWNAATIGTSGTGSSSYVYATNAYTLVSSGGTLNTTSDKFHFVSQALGQPYTIIAQLTLASSTDTDRAGVMMRDSTAVGAKYIMVDLKRGTGTEPNRKVVLQFRDTLNGSLQFLPSIGTTIPTSTCWLRLQRDASGHFHGAYNYISATQPLTEAEWTDLGAVPTSFTLTGSAPLVGLAAGCTSSSASATFKTVSVTPQ